LRRNRRTAIYDHVRTAAALHGWLDRAETSGIAVMEGFVGQLRRDVLAAEAAVTERWSNGPVEGQVNRSKRSNDKCTGGPASNCSAPA
jgi:transposase